MSKFKFHVRFSPCDFYVIDKWNLRTYLDENVRWEQVEHIFSMSFLQIVYLLQYVTVTCKCSESLIK